jgi:prenyltransferase beta subunit
LRLEMLQVARLAPKLLGDSAQLIEKFVRAQQNDDGGFRDLKGTSDLYYTVFGIESLRALQVDVPREQIIKYLQSFGSGEHLDFIHACCLARARASLDQAAQSASTILTRIEAHRAADGGYNVMPNTKAGTTYGAFLALGAYQDLRAFMPDAPRMLASLEALRTSDGAWANDSSLKAGSTNATAAAVAILRNLRVPIPDDAREWLLRRAHPDGGFLAAPNAPLPDLLSTATALHALAGLQVPLDSVLKERCLDFIDSLWTNEGSFYGTWMETHLDCEYTYYGLLALGHLSL